MRNPAGGEDRAGRNREGVVARAGERARGGIRQGEAAEGPVGRGRQARRARGNLDDIAGEGRVDVDRRGVTSEGRDPVGRIIGAEVGPTDEEARDQTGRAAGAEEVRELEFIGRSQAGRGGDVEPATRVRERREVERGEGERIRTGAGEIDGRVTVGTEHGGGLD